MDPLCVLGVVQSYLNILNTTLSSYTRISDELKNISLETDAMRKSLLEIEQLRSSNSQRPSSNNNYLEQTVLNCDTTLKQLQAFLREHERCISNKSFHSKAKTNGFLREMERLGQDLVSRGSELRSSISRASHFLGDSSSLSPTFVEVTNVRRRAK